MTRELVRHHLAMTDLGFTLARGGNWDEWRARNFPDSAEACARALPELDVPAASPVVQPVMEAARAVVDGLWETRPANWPWEREATAYRMCLAAALAFRPNGDLRRILDALGKLDAVDADDHLRMAEEHANVRDLLADLAEAHDELCFDEAGRAEV